MKTALIKSCIAATLCLLFALPNPLLAVTAYRITITSAQYPEADDNQQALLVMLQALQGIVNRTCNDKIWYQWQTNPLFMSWVQSNYGVTFNDTYASNPWGLFNHFKSQAGITQYIVYNLYDSSQNVARSMAGVLNAIPVTSAWVATAQSYGLTQALDVRTRNESWMYTNYWSSFNPHGLIEQYDGSGAATQQFLGDWATYRKYLMYYDGNGSSTFRQTVNTAAVDHSLNYGWGMDEFTWVKHCSQKNTIPVVANYSENFSLLTQLGNKRAAQKTAVHASPSLMPQAGKHYVAIVMSDGDNIQWMQRNFPWANWWGNSHRGQFKMNWEMNATCLDACPPVIQYYYNSATNNDFFVAGPSGTSYMYPRHYVDRDGYVAKMNNFIRESDLHVISVLDDGTDKSYSDKWAQAEETLGVIYKQYANYYKGTAGTRWVSGKPIKGYDYVMWENSGYPASATEIAGAINARSTNPTSDQNSYSLVNIHAWSYWGGDGGGSSVMDNVYLLVTSLNSNVQVVTAEEMIIMLRNQFGTPVTSTETTWTYQAESVSHNIGRADNDGWSANVAQDAPGYMTRGISLNTVTGSARAYFALMIDVLNAGNDKVVTCEVYNTTTGTVVASKDVYRWNFSSDFMYKEIRVDFTATAGHAYDFRVYWWDTSYVRQDYVRIVGTASSSDLAPVIAEVAPDPDSATVGTAYTKQLTLVQGTTPITWSVVSGPSGVQVNSSGYVSGWTPTSGQAGTTQTITIRATNAAGSDDESWQVYVNSLPDQIVATFPFNSDAQSWTLAGWKAGSFSDGTMAWDSASGNPTGNLKANGSGATNNDDSCTREGASATRAISTASYTNIQIEYDVIAILNSVPTSGCAGSCTGAVLEGSCEDKLAVYYSTSGTSGPWTLAQVLSEGVDLPTTWTRKTISLSGVTAANNNANFALQFKWQFNTTTDTGRIDNITVKGSGGPTNTAPQVNAGPDQTITLPSSANLDGTVSDDGLPNPPATVTVTWSKTSGPGTVTFGNANAVDTTAAFSTSGTYVLRLTASDSALSAYDEVTITVNPAPPGQATNPSPANGATGVSTSITLSWTAGSGATSHKVYFGTTTSPTYKTEQAGTTYNPGTLVNGTTYYWRIDEVNAGGTTTGILWSFTTIVAAPAKATNPSPANGATGVSPSATLSWTAGSGASTHKVYFGTTTSPTYQTEQSGTTFNPGTLANGTTYYWRIDEVNAGGTTTGDLWSFTTIVATPGKATNPSPANGATGVSTSATLSWTAGSGATTHKVYFGTTTSPTYQTEQSGTTFNPGTLVNGTTYYWRIDEVNAGGTTTGDLWSFTTIVATPGKATNPSPANGATGVSPSATLSWTAGSGATSHKVYFSTSNPPDYKTQQAETTFNPGVLSRLALYYWRIDEVNANGTTTGDLWTFTTASAPGDFDLDGDVDLADFGYLQGCYSGSDTPPEAGCENANLDGDNDVDEADFIIFRNCLGGADRPPGC